MSYSLGDIDKERIEDMFARPDISNWPSCATKAAGCGLYLLKVRINPTSHYSKYVATLPVYLNNAECS